MFKVGDWVYVVKKIDDDGWMSPYMDRMLFKGFEVVEGLNVLDGMTRLADYNGRWWFKNDSLSSKLTFEMLYAEAKRLNIPNRSRMNKAALQAAIIDQAGVVAPVVKKRAVEAVKAIPEPLEVSFHREVGGNPGVSSFAAEFTDGVSKNIRKICHAQMASLRNVDRTLKGKLLKVVEEISGHINKSLNPEAYEQYVEYIIHRSPWASCFLTKEWKTKSLVMDISKNVSKIVCAQVALRRASEDPGCLLAWKTLVDSGISENVAMIVSQYFGINGNKWCIGFVTPLGGGHALFSRNQEIEEIVSFFVNGWNEPEIPSIAMEDEAMTYTLYHVFDSIAHSYIDSNYLADFFEKYAENIYEGEGWDRVNKGLNEQKIFECAAIIEKMFKEVK